MDTLVTSVAMPDIFLTFGDDVGKFKKGQTLVFDMHDLDMVAHCYFPNFGTFLNECSYLIKEIK